MNSNKNFWKNALLLGKQKIPVKLEWVKNKNKICGKITTKWSFSLWVKEKNYPHIEVRWGFYSDNKKRDPEFRKICQELDLKNKNETDKYNFSAELENGLNIEIINSARISDLQDYKNFPKKIMRHFISFCKFAHPVIKTHVKSN